MALQDYLKVLLRAARLKATRRILSWRIQARHPTMAWGVMLTLQ